MFVLYSIFVTVVLFNSDLVALWAPLYEAICKVPTNSEKKRQKLGKNGVFEKRSGKVRKFDINLLMIRKFIITKNGAMEFR